MIQRIRGMAVLFALGLLCTTLAQGQDFPAPVAKLQVETGETVVFLGDSITHQCLYTQYVEDFFYTRFPQKRVRFHNAGVGGARAWDALERFDRDVASYHPKYVTVLLGMNDGRYQPYDEETFQTYRKDMTELIEKIRQSGAVPVLMTPTMYDSRAARMGNRPQPPAKLELYNSVLAYYGSWLREVAVERGFGFVDMYSPLNNLTLAQRKTEPQFTMIRDAVHPDAPGQLVMAWAILEDLGLRGPVSNIRLLRDDKGNPVPRVTGGKVSDLKLTDEGLEFTWLADALPFVVPAEAKPGADLLHLGHRISREALEVHGLAGGPYELSIDDNLVGTFTAVALARHVELQGIASTPQHQQAAQVAELNKQRNAGPVRSLRNEWSVFQQHSRLAKQSADQPDNQELKQQVNTLKQRLAGMDERVTRHEQAAKELEDKIFQINQPRPRKYTLRRIAAAAAN